MSRHPNKDKQLKFKVVVNKSGKQSILFGGQVFYHRYPVSGGLDKYQCRAFSSRFMQEHKNESCPMKLTVDLQAREIVEIEDEHKDHPPTYDPNEFKWNEFRSEVCDLVRTNANDARSDRSQHDVYNDWRRPLVGTGMQAIPTYKHVQSTLDRARRSQGVTLPSDPRDLKMKEMGLEGNWYSQQDDPKLQKYAQRYYWQLQEDTRIHCFHSGAQNKICKNACHWYVDGTFKETPRLKLGLQPWVQVLSIMVGHSSAFRKTHAYEGTNMLIFSCMSLCKDIVLVYTVCLFYLLQWHYFCFQTKKPDHTGLL